MTEAVLSELGSAPLDVDSCVGGSETRSTVGTRDRMLSDRCCGARLGPLHFLSVDLHSKKCPTTLGIFAIECCFAYSCNALYNTN